MRRLLAWGLAAMLMLLFSALPAQAATDAVRVVALSRVKAVAAAGDHYAALRADGSVWVWDGGGALLKPRLILGTCPVRAMAPGADQIALVCADGTVMTAGFAISAGGVQRAVQVPGLDSVKAAAMARTGLVALRTDGTVWVSAFGADGQSLGQAERVPDLSGIMAIAAGIDDFVAVGADGSAYARMAINTKGIPSKRVAGLPPVRSVAVCGPDDDCDGVDPYLFETGDGHIWTWTVGADAAAGPLGFEPQQCQACIDAAHLGFVAVTTRGDAQTVQWGVDGRVIVTDIKRPGLAPLKQMAAGSSFDLGLAADGSVWMWSLASRPSQVPGLSGIRAIAAAGDWNLALGADGQIWAWGKNSSQRTHIAPHVFETKSISASFDFYVLLGVDGSIAVGTWPAAGQLTAEPTVHLDVAAAAMAAGDMHVAILKFDGSVEAAAIAIDEAGVHIGDFQPVPGLNNAVQVAAGEAGYVALRADGTVWGARWGRPPVQVQDVAGARAVSASGDGYAVLLGDGSVRGIAIDEPGVHIWGDPHVDQADGIAGGSVALRADGTVYTYSRTVGAGQVTDILDGIAVAAGASQNLVLRADGTVWRWRAVGQ